MQLFRGARPESRADAVARRFRGALAELSTTNAEVSRRLGKPEIWVSWCASGSTLVMLDDLDAIEDVIGISANGHFAGLNEE